MTDQQAHLEANKAIVRRYRELHNRNDLDALDAIVAADLIAHNQLPGLPPGLAGGKLAHAGFLAAFPDGVTTTEDLIAEGDKVVERVTFTGTTVGITGPVNSWMNSPNDVSSCGGRPTTVNGQIAPGRW